MTGPIAVLLEDKRRLHLQHGPIDLIIEADGRPDEVAAAYQQATGRFENVLAELVEELPILRRQCPAEGLGLEGPVARRMERAVCLHAPKFITPMAAVAGAVADEILGAMTAGRTLSRAYVNNGGDIALWLAPGEEFLIGLVPIPQVPELAGKAVIKASDPVRGVATSGRHGRSLSFGIADAVTVLAADAASADAAATLIANAVDLPGDAAVARLPANEIDPDSDLGERMVTVDVGSLTAGQINQALVAGQARAADLHTGGLVAAAVIMLNGQIRAVGKAARRALPVEPAFA